MAGVAQVMSPASRSRRSRDRKWAGPAQTGQEIPASAPLSFRQRRAAEKGVGQSELIVTPPLNQALFSQSPPPDL